MNEDDFNSFTKEFKALMKKYGIETHYFYGYEKEESDEFIQDYHISNYTMIKMLCMIMFSDSSLISFIATT